MMSRRWWNDSALLQLLLHDLAEVTDLRLSGSLVGVDIDPPKHVGADVTLWFDHDLVTHAIHLDTGQSMINRIECVGRSCNLWVDPILLAQTMQSRFFRDRRAFGLPSIRQAGKLVVEHTSVNTLYPINVATFRGTAIGNAIRCFFKTAGAQAEAHYWVEARSRQYELLLGAIDSPGLELSSLLDCKGKPDHEVGYLYSSAVLALKNPSRNVPEVLSSMFPEAVDRIMASAVVIQGGVDSRNDSRLQDIMAINRFCVSGYNKTLQRAKVDIDVYDWEGESVTRAPAESQISMDYELRNVEYLESLGDGAESVLCVVPATMVTQPTPDRSLAARVLNQIAVRKNQHADRIHFYPYGQVYVQQEDEKTYCDHISSGFFSSVDSYVDKNCSKIGCHPTDAVNALKFTMLSPVNNSAEIVVQLVTDDRPYYALINELERACYSVSHYGDEGGASDLPATRSLIKAILNFEKAAIEQQGHIPEFRRYIRALVRLIHSVSDALRENVRGESVPAAPRILGMIGLTTALDGLEAIGICTTEGRLAPLRASLCDLDIQRASIWLGRKEGTAVGA